MGIAPYLTTPWLHVQTCNVLFRPRAISSSLCSSRSSSQVTT
ncbi:MAG: hypothetical protein WKF75_17070 [Singulisphaera sp.]